MKKLAILLALFFAASVFAADISGKWKGTAEAEGIGTIERTFDFKVDGTKLTGETESQLAGKSTIAGGKVEGENISFTITASIQGQEFTMSYKGKIVGDQIKLTVELPGGNGSAEYTLKRI